ncbi:winged helix-turn-helix domain-containing protein [Pantoea sp. BAV 3049]|uniref:winged helix-turn-helix domain-containing protein n=1 Tax=Pantoea sp. BAV 3049 TaxID=2654188 RepID=UPI00131EC481|nr:winged helix-turn-helix domain-containing protein [Pantoea sp. BAV 3049]
MENNSDSRKPDLVFIINEDTIFNPQAHKIFSIKKDFAPQEFNINVPASRCLMLLIENRGKVVTRDEFLKHVWTENGVFVSQNTYYQNISILRRKLRKAGLGDDIIVTIPHRGLTLHPEIDIREQSVNDSAGKAASAPAGLAIPQTEVADAVTKKTEPGGEGPERGQKCQQTEDQKHKGLQPYQMIIMTIIFSTTILLLNDYLIANLEKSSAEKPPERNSCTFGAEKNNLEAAPQQKLHS